MATIPAWLGPRRLRLASGLVLFTYLTTHYLNHTLGLISHEALDQGSRVFLLVWRNPAGATLLYGSVLIHVLLALWALYQRRSYRGLSGLDWSQLLLGLAVPPLIIHHILGTRIANLLYGTFDSYSYVLLNLWVLQPQLGLLQVAAVLAAWIHGCIGLRGWMRLRPWYAAWQSYLFAGALLLPTLALGGMLTAAREVARLKDQPGWFDAFVRAAHLPTHAQVEGLRTARIDLIGIYAAAILATLLARRMRAAIQRRRAVAVTYPDGRVVELVRGASILEASRQAGIPHAAVCGGRGRCSTCRVHVVGGLDALPPPGPEEQRVLKRIGAPPNVRLACQTRPIAPVNVVPLLPVTATARDGRARPGYLQGHEQEVAILFGDLRAFTRLAHQKLPYDTVFLLNRYFRAMGLAVEQADGHLDKFIGDGVMALFGVGRGAGEGSRRAIAAARAMSQNLKELNGSLGPELPEPLRIAIGIHVGLAIVGEMGYGRSTALTAIGDAVNTASRLEALAKELDVELVLSADVASHAGISAEGLERRLVKLRGRDLPLEVFVLARTESLPATSSARPRRPATSSAGPGEDASDRRQAIDFAPSP